VVCGPDVVVCVHLVFSAVSLKMEAVEDSLHAYVAGGGVVLLEWLLVCLRGDLFRGC